jgi:hypothetical protein
VPQRPTIWDVGVRLAIAAILVVAGCSSEVDGASRDSAAERASRVERCTQRLLQRAHGGPTEEAERYVRVTYCEPFERRGWVYEDGTLSIDAHAHVANSGTRTCLSTKLGEPTRTVPCEELDRFARHRVLNCALLHLVARSQVRKYVEGLQQRGEVECDDGTPLDKLGAG